MADRYIDTETLDWPLTERQIMERHPNVSFSSPFVPLEQYAVIVSVERPAFDPTTHRAVEAPPSLTAGVWFQQWVLEERTTEQVAQTLASLRSQQNEQVKTTRDYLSEFGGYSVVVDGTAKWFHSDGKSKTQQLALVMLGANVPAVQWKTMDGSFVTMTPTLAGAIFQAALQMDMALFSHAEALKAQVNAAADPRTVDVSAGWPATYGDSP